MITKQKLKTIKELCNNHKEIKVILDYEVLNHNIILINFMGYAYNNQDLSSFNYTFLDIKYKNKENAIKDFQELQKHFKFKFMNFLRK